MLESSSPIYTFTESDYDSSSPKFITNSDFPRNLRFATKVIPLKLSNKNHGVVTIEIHPSDNIDYGCVSFIHPNGASTSVSATKDGLYVPSDSSLMNVNVFMKDGLRGNTRFYIIVNSDQTKTSDILLINIGLGQIKVKDEVSSVSISYGCPVNVYSYNMGMHVYSPYDSIYSPKLRTILYSFTELSQWTNNTLVYSSRLFNNPSLPYYYGYGNKVYKVGGSLDRAFGTTTYYRTIKKNAFSKVKTTTITDGPRSYYDSIKDESPACVVPKMSDIGKIKEIILSETISQPLTYRYYFGFDNKIRENSSKNTFTLYSFTNKSHYPIIGSVHALIKLGAGLLNGYDYSEFDWRKIVSFQGMSGIMNWKSGNNFAAAGAGVGVASLALNAIIVAGTCVCTYTAASTIMGLNVIPGIGTIIAIGLLAVFIVIKLFKKTTIVTQEDCKIFLHRYCSTPYIETNRKLFNKNGSNATAGFYCDGIYYYYQNYDGIITSKTECSGSFYNYFQEGSTNITYSQQSSITPDNPTLVTLWEHLIVLPYTSGKPEPICKGTIYYSILYEKEVPNNCCGLEIFTPTKITIPAGQEFSCISQLDANNKAKTLLDTSYEYAITHGNYSESIPDEYYGILDSKFTNVSWVEFELLNSSVISESVRLFFDNRDMLGLIVGKTVYFDPSGCQKALEGYYTGAPYGGSNDENPSKILINQPVKTYQVESGKIKTITNETKTITFYPSYISNWFLTDVSISSLLQIKQLMDDSRTFDPTTLENNVKCYQGLIKKTSSDYSVVQDLLLFSGNTYVPAPEGFYLPLIDWIEYNPFYYSKPDEIVLNISENCDTKTIKGFNIIGISKTTNSNTPVHNEVTVEVIVKSVNNKSKTYTATTSSTLTKTLIPYGSFFNSSDIISEITITKILTKSPLNNITYSIGGSYLCPNINNTIIPCGGTFSPNANNSNLSVGYYEMITNIGELTGITSIDFNAGDTPDRFQIYWNDKLVGDSLFVGDSLNSSNRQYYINEILKIKSLNKFVFENNVWKQTIPQKINTSYSLSDIASNGVRLSENSVPSPQVGVDRYYGADISDGNVRLKFNKLTSLPSYIRIVIISPLGGSNWVIDKLNCNTPPSIIPFKYRLNGDGTTLSKTNQFGFVFNDAKDSISFSRCNEFSLSSPYLKRTASLQIKSPIGEIPITLKIYKNDIFFSSVTSTTIQNEWSLGGTLLSSTINCENVNDYYTFSIDYTQPITYVARVYITTSFSSYNTLGQYLGVGNNYNYIAQEIPTLLPTPTPTTTPTPTPAPAYFIATLTVGNIREITWGYMFNNFGSITNQSINLPIGGTNIILKSVFWTLNSDGLGGTFTIRISNNSSTIIPNWTRFVVLGNLEVFRASMIEVGYKSSGEFWEWSQPVARSPFGSISGQTRTITLT